MSKISDGHWLGKKNKPETKPKDTLTAEQKNANEEIDRNDSIACPQIISGAFEPIFFVNLINMNFFMIDVPLWYFPEEGPSIKIALNYNSQSSFAYHEPFGNKWQFNYGTYLVIDPGTSVTVFMPDGRRDVYSKNSSGQYVAPVQSVNVLTELSENHFKLTLPDGTAYIYNIPENTDSIQPYLVALEDAQGKSLQFAYNTNAQLTTITDAQGKISTITYTTEGLVSKVEDPFGRSANFTYDVNRNLIKLSDMGGVETRLTYDEDVYLSSIDYGQGVWDIYIAPAVDTIIPFVVVVILHPVGRCGPLIEQRLPAHREKKKSIILVVTPVQLGMLAQMIILNMLMVLLIMPQEH